MSVDAKRVIAGFVALRDQRTELRKRYEQEDAELETKQDKLKAWLAKTMQEVGTDQLSGREHGTAFRQIKRRFNAKDWPIIWAFIKEHDRFDMLEKRLGQKAISDFLEESGVLPPGMDMFQEYEIVVRRG